jgi:hypothetical protein
MFWLALPGTEMRNEKMRSEQMRRESMRKPVQIISNQTFISALLKRWTFIIW